MRSLCRSVRLFRRREVDPAGRERRQGFGAATAECHRLERAYPRLGYRTVVLPKSGVEARADFVLAELPGSLT